MPGEERAIRVFLVDDHRIVRSGVAAYLEQVDDIEVVGEAGDGRQALDRIAAAEPGDGLPDVVLMDLLMPGLDGISATREIRIRWPAVEVVALTSFSEEAKVRGALEAGAAGYLLKDADADDVARAIRAAVAGQMHLDVGVARLLADSLRAPRRPADTLTPRERRCSRWWPGARRTVRSPRPWSSASAPPARTCQPSSPSWTSSLVPRLPCGRCEKETRTPELRHLANIVRVIPPGSGLVLAPMCPRARGQTMKA